MNDFDWRTDEEKGWEELQGAEPSSGARRGRFYTARTLARKQWRALLASLLLVGAVGLLGARGLTLRVEEAEDAVRAEALAAHALLVDAAGARDAELYLTMLGGDRAWRQSQLTMIENDVLFERRWMGLTWREDVEPASEVMLSPDLQRALITSTLRYEGYTGAGADEAVSLQHVFHYERDGARWRLVPEDEESWEGWITDSGEQVGSVFPGRDELFGVRLTDDIREMVREVCGTHISCPPTFQLRVRLERNGETLHAPALSVSGPLRNELTLGLPAPSLFGVPIDEASYRAMRNAYFRTIVVQLFDALARNVGGASSALHDARQRLILADMDLTPWPPAMAVQPEAGAFDGDIVAMCVIQPGAGAELLRYDALGASWQLALEGRDLLQMASLHGAPGVLLREQQETFRRTTEPQPSIIWWGDGRELARFEPFYLGEVQANVPAFSAASLDGQSHWIYLGGAHDCDGTSCSGVEMKQHYTVWSPDGQHTLVHRPQEGSQSPPAGDVVLWLGDEHGEPVQQLGEGYNPFWIDNETFGYLLISEGNGQAFAAEYELVFRGIDGGAQGGRDRLPLDLVEALQTANLGSADSLEMGMGISGILAHPSRPNTIYVLGLPFSWLVSSVAAPERSDYMFMVDRQSGEVAVHSPGGTFFAHRWPQLSPDGRWLAVSAFHTVEERGVVAVYDLFDDPASDPVYYQVLRDSVGGPSLLANGSPQYDWSSNGQLLVLADGLLTTLDPREWQPRQLVPPTAGCAHAAWAD